MAELQPHSFIKICGVTNEADLEVVIEAGADALGLILAPSPRQLSLERAGELARLASGRILVTAVFRDTPDSSILANLDGLDVDVVQLHDRVGPELVEGLRRREVLIVKALAIDSDDFMHFDESLVDAVLVDGPLPGSGAVHAWEALARRSFAVPVIAAGGLNAKNVASTVVATGAWGVDSASGVESAPGRKDHTLVQQFVDNARRAMEARGVR